MYINTRKVNCLTFSVSIFLYCIKLKFVKVRCKEKLKFPEHITKTIPLRPDIFPNITRKLLIYELTVPYNENIPLAHKRKRSKYLELNENCKNSLINLMLNQSCPVERICSSFFKHGN